jgi:hypothetical protein
VQWQGAKWTVVELTTFLPFHQDLLYIKRVKSKPLMATRSRIGIELKDGSILSAYHHWDGYESWLGRILNTHYNSRTKASELIDGGDMSAAWGDENRAEYYSERGEDCPPRLDKNLEEYFSDNEEYSYVFRNGEWVCYNMNEFNDKDPEIVEIPAGNLAV